MAPIRGQCTDFCCENERNERVLSHEVNVLERIAGMDTRHTMIKKYRRTAAAKLMDARNIRPVTVLRACVSHMWLQCADRPDVCFEERYRFLSDRLRCVRQDMTVQRAAGEEVVAMLEEMVRLLTVARYELWSADSHRFDRQLNAEQIQQCLTSLRAAFSATPALPCVRQAQMWAWSILFPSPGSKGAAELAHILLRLPNPLLSHTTVRRALAVRSLACTNPNVVGLVRCLRTRCTLVEVGKNPALDSGIACIN